MTLTAILVNAWLTSILFFQAGSVPIWVPLTIILLIILIFWWGLTRNRIPDEGEPATEHEADESEAADEPAAQADETEAEDVIEPAPETEVADQTVDDEVVDPESPPEPDDLKIIEGIGPKIAGILIEANITTYDQLADTSVEELERIVREEAGIKIANPASWPGQATLAAAGDWDGLEDLQKRLVAGRHRD